MALLFMMTVFSASLKAQLIGTKNIPGDYPTLASAITDLNTQGVGAGGVTINLITGNPETAPVGGYAITATGTGADQIIITGNNNTITAPTPQTSGSKVDALFKIIGGDYITIEGFNLVENTANITTAVATNNMTEFGVAIFAGSATNGAQNNTIQNNIITLSNVTAKYQNAIGVFSSSSSSSTGAAQSATSSAGTNSYNKFYANTISGVFHGMYFLTVTQTASIIEEGIDIGGTSIATGNTITFGVTNTASNLGFNLYAGGFAGGIFLRNGVDYSIRYNTIYNPSTYSITTVGIYANFTSNTLPAGVPVTANMSNNSVTLNHSGNADGTAIDFGTANSNASTHIGNNNNVTINLTHNVANGGGGFFGVRSSCTSSIKTFTSNTVTINETTSGTYTANTSMTGVDANGTTADIQILSNSITFNQTTSSTASVTGNITGIRATTAATNVTIGSAANGNTVTVKQVETGAGAYGAGVVTYINAAANHRNLSITDNVINNTGSSQLSTGTTIGINHNGAIVTSLNVSRNLINIEGGITTGPATLHGIWSGGTSGITNYFILSNSITLNAIAASAVNGIYNGDGNASTVKTFSLNNITITGSANVVRGIYNNTGKGIITTNTISLSSAAVAPTSMTGFEIAAAAPYANEITNNTITSLNFSGAITNSPTMNGILVTSANGAKVYNSSITNITAGALGSTGSPVINGISINGGTGALDVYKNKIYNLLNNSASGSVIGIASSGGTNNNIYNNIIGDLQTPYTNSVNGVVGVNLSGGTTLNVHYNTVYLNAISTGTLFGSSAVSTNGASTTINLRNNIFVNNSTPTGTAITVAFRRNVTTFTNYGAASNNNLFYASAPSASTAIFYDGTTVQQTLTDFKTIVGPTIDAASVTENPVFASTVSSNPNFLHFTPATNTAIESGGIAIATVSDDFDADIRQGDGGYTGTGSSPDIGADEFEGITSNLVINGLAITPTGNQCTTVSRNVTATVTPGAAPLTAVTLNYSFNGIAQTPIVMTGGSFTTTSIWNETIPASVPVNANVNWYITATDGTITKTSNGASYKDEPLLGIAVTGSIAVNDICAGSSTTLSPNYSSTSPNTSYPAAPSVTNPTTNEDIGNVTFGALNNTTSINSLVGTLGTATGVAGRNSDFTALGSFNFTAGNTYTMSLSSLQGASTFSNAFGVYIDYNRNGSYADAGEAVYLSVAPLGVGAHTETVSITIPATANNGLTRMRVICREGSPVPSPTTAFAYGESEEYMLNILSTNNGGGSSVIPPFISYAWYDGTSTIATTSVTVQTPNVTTNYTFTATDANGCSVISAPVTVSVIAFPSAPVASNSSQCGYGVPTASVSGSTSYNWYATPTSTTVLQSGSSDTYTTPIGATTTWYVTSLTGVCENTVRTAVTQSVSIPDLVTPNTSSSNLCVGGANTITLTAVQTGTNGNLYSFTWDASSTTGSGMPTTMTGTNVIITPTLTGNYTYSVTATDGLCTTISTVTVALNDLPAIIASATPTAICSGENVNLNALTMGIGVGTTTVGTGATNSTTYPNPFYSLWSNTHNQYLITAAELTAANVSAGNINSLAIQINSGVMTMQDFSIKIGHSVATNMSAFVNNAGFTTVFNAASVTPVVGLNTLIFSTPFNWDGISNIVIEICHGNSGSSVTMSSSVKVDNTSYVSTIHTHKSAASAGAITCSDLTTNLNTYSIRPKFIFSANTMTTISTGHDWQWNPGAINSNTAVINPINTGSVASTEIYTATVTNTITTCSNTTTVNVLVNIIPSAPVVSDNIQCGVGVPTASVSGGTSYNWYATPTSTPVLQTGASTNYTNSTSSTTQWYVSSYDGLCESPRVILTQTVTIPDQITTSVSSASVCPNTSAILTAVSSGTTNNYAYTWAGDPISGSGIPTSVTGNTVSIIPTTPGSYAYTVTAFDGTCTAVSSTSLMVYEALTMTPTVAANPNPLCTGNNATLTAVFGSTTNPSYTLPPTVTYPTTDEDLGNITFGPLNNTTARNSLVGTIGTASGTSGNYSNFTSFGPFTFYTGTTYTLSLSSLQNITAYNNRMAAYIDYNRNGVFTDAGEAVYVAGASVFGAHTETATVTIPVTASIGNTRIRVFVIETSSPITGPNQTLSYGEYEEYTLNILPNLTYAWTDGSSTIGTTNPLVVAPSNNTTYSFVGTDNNGCSVNSTALTVTVNTTPTVTAVSSNTAICSGTSATFTASGATNYTWSPSTITTSIAVVSPTANATYTVTGESLGCSSTATLSLVVNTTPTVSASASSTLICSGGANSATLTATSTTTDYSWTPTGGTASTEVVTPSGNTVYTVTSNNVGCIGTATVGVNVNTTPTVNAVATATDICSGTIVTLTASGTATNYTWTPTGDLTTASVVNPTVTTSYVVTGESLGCKATATIDVNVTETPTVTASANPTVICLGGNAALTAVSSTPNYSWSPAGGTSDIAIVSPSATTIYTVTSTNGACVSSTTVSLDILSTPVLTVSPSSSTVCAASSTTLTASGADTYTWSTAGGNAASAVFTPTAMATYTVAGTNACGTGSTTATIDVTSPLTINATTSSTMICSGETATLTASGTASSFTWTPGGQTTAIVAVTPTTSTIYTVSSSNVCGVVTATVNQNVSPCAGIQELESANISVYPNPSTGIVNFDITSELAGNVSLEMYDAIGKLVVKEELTKEHTVLNLSKLEEGIYIFKMIRNNGDVKIGRFVKHN